MAAVLVSAVSAEAGTGSDRTSTVFRIEGYVPVICRVQLGTMSGVANEDGVVDLGVAEEFCNAPRGYRVLINHSPGLDGAAVISNGVRIPLSGTGETVLSDSSHANFRRMPLAVDLGDDPTKFRSLGVRIEARA